MRSAAAAESTAAGFYLIPPRDGGWTLLPMENLLRGMRDQRQRFALEMFSHRGAVNLVVRCYDRSLVSSLVQSYYPQSHAELMDPQLDDFSSDWLRLDHGEYASVLPMTLARASWLPLATVDNDKLLANQSDPIAGVLAALSNATRPPDNDEDSRVGIRLVLQPAAEQWSRGFQQQMQSRRDGEDRKRNTEEATEGGMTPLWLALGGAAVLAGVNYAWISNGELARAVGLDLLAISMSVAGYLGWQKVRAKRTRPYLDEVLVEEKLKSLGFQGELQLVYIDRDESTREDRAVLDRLANVLRQFDDPAGNQWHTGRMREFRGSGLDLDDAGLAAPAVTLEWLETSRARNSILSAREVSTLWHPPLGEEDIVPMKRGGANVRVPFLEGLDHGAFIGHSEDGRQEIRIPPEVFAAHGMIIGSSGVGKTTLAMQEIYDFIQAKARGENDDALFVLDPHADLVRDVLEMIPESVAHKVKLIDFGHPRYVPALNLLDPRIFTHRDRCTDTIVSTLRALSENAWGNRVSELLSNTLKMLFEANEEALARNAPEDMLTILDVVPLLGEGHNENRGGVETLAITDFQKDVRGRVRDFNLRRWFDQIMTWDRRQRSEAFPPVLNRIGRYLMDRNARVVMGQRESTIRLNDLLENGDILLVSTAKTEVGEEPAAVLGGTMVSLMYSALLAQSPIPEPERKRCLMVVDEFQTIPGAPWEEMFAEVRKYGGRLLLLTQGLARLDSQDRNLKEGILANLGFLAAYRVSGDDAAILSRQMTGGPDLQSDLVKLNPFTAYLKVITGKSSLPIFTLRTLPPPKLPPTVQSGVARVMELMPAYSCDRSEALVRMAREVEQQVQLEKIGGRGFTKNDDKGTTPGAYDHLIDMGRQSRAHLPKALDGIPLEDIEASEFHPEVLAEMVKKADKDRGIRHVVDIRRDGTVTRIVNRKMAELKEGLAATDPPEGAAPGSGAPNAEPGHEPNPAEAPIDPSRLIAPPPNRNRRRPDRDRGKP